MLYKKRRPAWTSIFTFNNIDPWPYSKRLSAPALHSGFAGVTAHKYSLYVLVDILNAPDTKWASCRGGDSREYALVKTQKGFGEGSAL
jgi:hypothetical protein